MDATSTEATERMPGDAEAAGAIAAMTEAQGWAVGDYLTFRWPGVVDAPTAARVTAVLSSGKLIVQVDSPTLGESGSYVITPQLVCGF